MNHVIELFIMRAEQYDRKDITLLHCDNFYRDTALKKFKRVTLYGEREQEKSNQRPKTEDMLKEVIIDV